MPLNPQPVDYFNDLTTLGSPGTGWFYGGGSGLDSPGRDHNGTCLLCQFGYPNPGRADYITGSYHRDMIIGFAFRYSRVGVGEGTPGATLYIARNESSDVSTDIFYIQLQPDSTIAFFTETGLYLAGPSQPIQQDAWYWLEFSVGFQTTLRLDPLSTILNVGINGFYLQGQAWPGGPLQPYYYVTPPGALTISDEYNVHGFQAGGHDIRFQDLFIDWTYVPEVPTYPNFYGDSKLGTCPSP